MTGFPSGRRTAWLGLSLALLASAAVSEEKRSAHRHGSRGHRHLQHRRRHGPNAEEIQDICLKPKPKFNVEEAVADLKVNRVKFSGFDNYDMRIQRSCYCYGNALDPYLLSVRNGITTSVTNERTGEAMNLDDYRYRLPTITDLFDIIDTACTKPYANLFVTYDADRGYPTSVGYDKNECIADEENSYTVTNFVDMSQMFVDTSTNLRWRRRRYHQG